MAINTAAVRRPELISEVSRKYGSQCMVSSIEAKRKPSGGWEVYTDCGRESSGVDAVDWASKGVSLGAGEILVTSIDQEGTRKGFDNELINSIASVVNVPIIASGGYGQPEHLECVVQAGADAVAFADALHYSRTNFESLRGLAHSLNFLTRT